MRTEKYELHHGDCREVMATMADESVDAIVTDPPYGLSFMGKGWDHGVPGEEFWAEALRVAKPGAHLLAFGGTRTYHRLACAIEDAGWEIRDTVGWIYGSGFPKSLDVSKAIDKAAGAEREVVGRGTKGRRVESTWGGQNATGVFRPNADGYDLTSPATPEAQQWAGWGTALKPAWEPVIVARKPLMGTVAANVLEHGTGAINVDGCRVGTEKDWPASESNFKGWKKQGASIPTEPRGLGRWPANIIHDGSDEATAPFGSAARFFKCCPPDTTCPLCCLPYAEACDTMQAWKNTLASIAEKRGWTSQATSEFIARVSAIGPASERIVPHVKSAGNLCDSCAISIAVALVATKTSAFSNEELQATLASTGNYSDSILIPSLAFFAELWASIDTTPTTNSLSLLFGCVRDAIASSTRRDTKEKAEPRSAPSRFAYCAKASKSDRDAGCERNTHPTVKPTDLMRYLCRLVTPPGGVVLDPFMGSGSTGKAALLEGFRFIGIEREAEYLEIARARIEAVQPALVYA